MDVVVTIRTTASAKSMQRILKQNEEITICRERVRKQKESGIKKKGMQRPLTAVQAVIKRRPSWCESVGDIATRPDSVVIRLHFVICQHVHKTKKKLHLKTSRKKKTQYKQQNESKQKTQATQQ
jgi:16S rRNA C1402 (ribose-2'-O) methylase RsmI